MMQLSMFGEATKSRSVDVVVAEIASRLRAVNIVSFSGGKDSTTVLELVLAAMAAPESRGKRLYIVTSDTMMEC